MMTEEKNGFLTLQVGAVRVTVIVERAAVVSCDPINPLVPDATADRLRGYPWLYPAFVTEDDQMAVNFQAFVLEAPALTIVVDTCIGNHKPRDAHGIAPMSTAFLEDMARAGFARNSIDQVICTHLHFDHVGWNTMLEEGRWVPTFPRARYLFGREEYADAQKEADEVHGAHIDDSVRPVVEAGLVDLVETDHCICDEIRLIPTPGHTPGHVSVLIESQGRRAVITGDMTHHPCQIAQPGWGTPFDSDRPAAAATRRRLFEEWAVQDVLVIGSHFAAPTAGRIVRDGETFRLDC